VRDAHILISSTNRVRPLYTRKVKAVTLVDAKEVIDMEKCPKCGIPAVQLYNGTCMECMLFQPHRDPEPVTYAEKLKALLQNAGTESFFSGMSKMWSGSILVRYSAIPFGRAPMYMYFERGHLVAQSASDDTTQLKVRHIGIVDMAADDWHILPEDMEAEAPVESRRDRAIDLLTRCTPNEWARVFAHCEHAETWMQQ